MVLVAEELDVIDPDVVSFLDTQGVSGRGQHFADDQVANNDVRLLDDSETDTGQLCFSDVSDRMLCRELSRLTGSRLSEQAGVGANLDDGVTGDGPYRMSDRFHGVKSAVSPETMTILALSPATAEVNADRVVTVVVVPPFPPEVLRED